MSLTVEKLLSDAKTLISRLKEQDSNADSIMSTSQMLHRRIEAMKQYQDDITELNEMAKHRPRSSLVLGLAQENRRIRELQQEKQELGVALEEHQSALQLIMHKYRQHTLRLLHANRIDAALRSRHAPSKEEVVKLLDKVEEMASVMQQAVRLDDTNLSHTQERITRLERENHTLRQLLEICSHPPSSDNDHPDHPPSITDSGVFAESNPSPLDGASRREGEVEGEKGKDGGTKSDDEQTGTLKS